MQVILYSTKSEIQAVNKSLTELATVEGTLREKSSILTPSFNLSNVDSYIHSCNYAYVPDFHRYYFVGKPISVRTGLWSISLRVDVLMTYKEGIKLNKAIIARNENQYDLKLNDGLFKVQQNPRIAQFEFPNGFSTFNFVLAIAGN